MHAPSAPQSPWPRAKPRQVVVSARRRPGIVVSARLTSTTSGAGAVADDLAVLAEGSRSRRRGPPGRRPSSQGRADGRRAQGSSTSPRCDLTTVGGRGGRAPQPQQDQRGCSGAAAMAEATHPSAFSSELSLPAPGRDGRWRSRLDAPARSVRLQSYMRYGGADQIGFASSARTTCTG